MSLETFLFFGGLWDVVFWLFSFSVFIWKGARLPYPQTSHNYYGLEISYLFMYLLVEPARLFLGSKAGLYG